MDNSVPLWLYVVTTVALPLVTLTLGSWMQSRALRKQREEENRALAEQRQQDQRAMIEQRKQDRLEEHDRWLRDKKAETYGAALLKMHKARQLPIDWKVDRHESYIKETYQMIVSFAELGANVHLYGADEVVYIYDKASDFFLSASKAADNEEENNDAIDSFIKCHVALIEAVREDTHRTKNPQISITTALDNLLAR